MEGSPLLKAPPTKTQTNYNKTPPIKLISISENHTASVMLKRSGFFFMEWWDGCFSCDIYSVHLLSPLSQTCPERSTFHLTPAEANQTAAGGKEEEPWQLCKSISYMHCPNRKTDLDLGLEAPEVGRKTDISRTSVYTEMHMMLQLKNIHL